MYLEICETVPIRVEGFSIGIESWSCLGEKVG